MAMRCLRKLTLSTRRLTRSSSPSRPRALALSRFRAAMRVPPAEVAPLTWHPTYARCAPRLGGTCIQAEGGWVGQGEGLRRTVVWMGQRGGKGVELQWPQHPLFVRLPAAVTAAVAVLCLARPYWSTGPQR